MLKDFLSHFQPKNNTALAKKTLTCTLFCAMLVPVTGNNIVSLAHAETMAANTVVVTATRTEQFLEDVSANIQVITQEEIKRLGATTVMDALRVAKSVQVSSKLSIRGMPQEGTTILINGRRPAGELKYGTGANRTLERIDINRVERIEILAGPSSALYGSTTGGVINIITKKSEEQSATAGIVLGNRELRNYYSLDSGAMGAFDLLLNASYTKLHPNNHKFNDSIDADGSEYYMSFDLGYDINENHRLILSGDYFAEDYFTLTSINDNGTRDKTTEEALRSSATLNYEGNVGDHFYNITATYSQLDETLKGTENNVYDQYAIEFKDSWDINENHLLTFGGEFTYNNIDAPSILAEKINSTYFAFYVQDEISLFDDTVFITPAVRMDNYEDWGMRFSPKLGLVWKFHENHRFKANAGLGFRAPSFDELYRFSGLHEDRFNENENGFYRGNPDLKPEESISWDISYEGEYKNLSGSVTYYWNDIKNQIGGWNWIPGDNYVPGAPTGVENGYFTFLQTAKARTQGIELSLGYDFLDYFTIAGQYTWLDARDMKDNSQLSSTAKHTFLAQFIFAQPEWGTSVVLWSEWVNGMRYTSRNNNLINYNTANISVRQKVMENFTVYASVDNIFNSITEENLSFIDPMEWKLGFEVTF